MSNRELENFARIWNLVSLGSAKICSHAKHLALKQGYKSLEDLLEKEKMVFLQSNIGRCLYEDNDSEDKSMAVPRNVKSLDITCIMHILQNSQVLGYQNHHSTWKSDVKNVGSNFIEAACAIRAIRNKHLGHITEAKINERTYFQLLRDLLDNLAILTVNEAKIIERMDESEPKPPATALVQVQKVRYNDSLLETTSPRVAEVESSSNNETKPAEETIDYNSRCQLYAKGQDPKIMSWTDQFLNSVSSNYHLPESARKECIRWDYKGNGEYFHKFLKIYAKDKKAPNQMCIVADEEWAPIKGQMDKLNCLHVSTCQNKKLSERSEAILCNMISYLFQLLPSLKSFGMNSHGNPVPQLESLWNKLPDSTERIDVHQIPLSANGINGIVNTITKNQGISELQISYEKKSWKHILSLVDQVSALGKIKHITLSGCRYGEGEVLETFLHVISEWKGGLDMLHLDQFSLSETQVDKLSKAIPKLKNAVEKIKFSQMKLQKQHIAVLQEQCTQMNIEFETENCSNVEPNYHDGENAVVWTDEFLKLIPYDYILLDPQVEKKYSNWDYEGNGENIRKFLNIYRNNRNAVITVVIVIESEEWMPINLHRNPVEKMKGLVISKPKILSEESERNLFKFISDLFALVPCLQQFAIQGHYSAPELDSLWNRLPDSVERICLRYVPLSENGIYSIASTIQQRKRIDELRISFDNDSLESLLSLIHEVKNLKNITYLYLKDGTSGGDSEKFVKYLDEVAQWKHNLNELCIRGFFMSEAHMLALRLAIPRMKSVKSLCLSNMKAASQHIEMLREMALRYNINFVEDRCSPP